MSDKVVEYHQGATEDVRSALTWYKKRSLTAAVDFLEELNRAAATIKADPERWPIGENNTRRFLLWRFPFAIIYSEENSAIMVWAVAHGSRRPEYWRVGCS